MGRNQQYGARKQLQHLLPSAGSRHRIIVNATITGLTGESFVSHGKKLNSEVFAEFLGVLLERYSSEEITLVVDKLAQK